MFVSTFVASLQNYASLPLALDISNRQILHIFYDPLVINNLQWLSQEILLTLLGISLVIIFFMGTRIMNTRKDSNNRETLNESLSNYPISSTSINDDVHRFIGIVSHDIRSPLSSISAISEIMAMDADQLPPEEIKEYAGNIQDLTVRINNLVSNMKDANRIDLGEVKLELNPLKAEAIAKEAYDSLKVLGNKKGIETTLSIQDNLPKVVADQDALKRVLENLINNAYKFSDKHSTVKIDVEYLKKESKVKLSISDEGPGFTQDDRKKLYQKFSKLSAVPTGGEKTTGLGLFIVHNLVERMNGSIHLDSTPGEGSVFSVILGEAK
jgi:signal transduction histidine kinase